MVVTISFTSHNHFLFLTWKVSYQTTCPTILFKSSHERPMLQFGRNETLRKSRKSIMFKFHNWPGRGLSVNCGSGHDTTAKGLYISQGEVVRTCTLKFLPGTNLYEIGAVVPNHTRGRLLSSKVHIIIWIQVLLYVVSKHISDFFLHAPSKRNQ